MEGVGLFYGHLVYFMPTGFIVWPFGILYRYLVYFFPFGYVVPITIWQPCVGLAPENFAENRSGGGGMHMQVFKGHTTSPTMVARFAVKVLRS
jgi:hypothetical protein